MSTSNTIRVAIVDDHAIVRQGLRNLLTKRNFEVVGEANCGHTAIKLAQQHNPDVMLLDIRMKNCDGLNALPEIKQASPQTKIIILTTYSNTTYFSQAIQRGACGYLLKDSEPEDIVNAITFAASQQYLFDPNLLSQVMQPSPAPTQADTTHHNDFDAYTTSDESAFEPLSEREHEVLALLAQSLSNPQIAEQLHLSLPTVKTHVTHILRKLNAKDRTQAVLVAIRYGLLHQ